MLEDIKLNYKEYDEIKILRCYNDFLLKCAFLGLHYMGDKE